MKKSILLNLLCLISPGIFAESFVGKVIEKDGKYLLKNSSGISYEIVLDKKYQYSLPTTVSDYLQKYEGTLKSNKIYATEISTTVAGNLSRKGLLTRGKNNRIYLDAEEVQIREGKILNGHRFDEASVASFINTKVEVEGSYILNKLGKRIFQVRAIIPSGLFSADKEDVLPRVIEEDLSKSRSDLDFFIRDFPLNKYAQSKKPFRKTVYQKKGTSVKSGEDGLVLTLSGRTGDVIGSSAGHFVTGRVKVNSDLSLRGDIFNSYVPNKKEIFSANTSLPYYYGQVVGGQNIHRPTYNCTTINMSGLKRAGFYGDHDRVTKKITDIQNLGFLNPLCYIMNHNKGAGALSYALATDPERYIPRNGFESYLKILRNKRFRKKMGITRVDFVYLNQIPSSRPLGRIPYLGVRTALKVVKMVKEKRSFDKGIEKFLNSLGERK